jgi:hypothetical protein
MTKAVGFLLKIEHPEEQDHCQVWSDAPARHQLLHLDPHPRQVGTVTSSGRLLIEYQHDQ